MRRHLMQIAAAMTLGLASATAVAQAFPDKPVRLVVAYPAGGGLDFVGRTLAQQLSEVWRQPVTVDNRSGASGAIGADSVAKARPDGLTLLLASPAEVLVGPIAGQKTPYDAEKAFVPVILAGETPLAVVAHPAVGANQWADLVSAVRKNNLSLSYGTPGAGSSMHFAGEAMSHASGIPLVHVPYRGAAPAVNDVLGNQVPLAIVGMPPVMPHARSGKLKVLAVTTAKRSPVMPDVPSISELPGMSGYQFSNWMMVLAPAGTAGPVVEKIAADVSRVLQDPAVRARLLESGVQPLGVTGQELSAFMQQERARYASVARMRNIRYAD
jgi:tripartite-type tricarboxylate transporter receptor subunit TctC